MIQPYKGSPNKQPKKLQVFLMARVGPLNSLETVIVSEVGTVISQLCVVNPETKIVQFTGMAKEFLDDGNYSTEWAMWNADGSLNSFLT